MWDRDRVVDYFREKMGGRICELPILRDGPEDRVG